MPGKTHHTAVAVVPPPEVCEPIQAIRRRHDRQINRWMPHVNLIYPFLPRADFPTVLPALAAASASIEAFSITFGEFRFFRHGSGRCTLWLAPEPAAALWCLQAVLQAAFPDCDNLGHFPAGFTPHLSVGQFPSPRDCERTREQLQAGWRPITFALGAIALLARGPDGPFGVVQEVPLGEAHRP